jgi:RHS repeat-associated protein
VRQQRRITNRLLVALSAFICLCGRLAPCVSAFSQRATDPASEWPTGAKANRLALSRMPNPASRITRTYNALNRLDLLIDRSPTNTIINCWKYHTTGAGQRTWVEEFDHRTAWYTYDNLGRLKTETVTGSIQDGKNGTVTYGYDNVGNRQTRSSSLPGVTNQALGYDANDRLNGDQYDNNGNTKSAPVSQPTTLNSQQVLGTDDYDSENRLTQRTGTNGSAVRLVYDGDGNRICEIVNGQIKSYLIDHRNPTGYAQVVEEIVNSVVNHTYTYGHDLISQDQFDPLTNNWHASFYAYDGRGTVRFLTNETGAVTDTYVYDAFGTLITATGSTNNRYLYTGEQFDPNLGLYYLRARLMNPLTGRLRSMDRYQGSQSDPLSLHKCLYANADPANNIDPSGDTATLAEVGSVNAIIGDLARMTVTAALLTSVAEMPFRNWTVRLGIELDEFHTFLSATSKDGTYYRYDVSLSPRNGVLAKKNPFKKYPGVLQVSRVSTAAEAEAGTIPVAKLSNFMFPVWYKYVTGNSGGPGEDVIPLDYVYAYQNCLTYSGWWAANAFLLSLIPL